MGKLSAVVIAFNEERDIARCLRSVQPVADEIIVVDSYSTDRTREICQSLGARVIEHPFKSHIDQKNFALQQAACDFVLSLDADEYLSDELLASIQKVKGQWAADAYAMNRLSSYQGKWVRHGSWYPDQKVRLWRRGVGTWGGQNPHDRVILEANCRIHHLSGDIRHRAYENAREILEKIQSYSEIFARENRAEKISGWTVALHSAFAFFQSFVLKRGFLDGYEGLMVAVTSANHTFYKYAKLREQGFRNLLGKRVIISRTDNLGDVILTLPLIGYIRKVVPDAHITFIGRSYTRPVLEQCKNVDVFLNREDVLSNPSMLTANQPDSIIFVFPDKALTRLAKKSGIPTRVATGHRIFNWWYCNFRVNFSRIRSSLHESQLNFKLLGPFRLEREFETADLIPFYGLKPESRDFSDLLDKSRTNVVLHPKSKGSAREWSLANFCALAESLSPNAHKIFITGLADEGKAMREAVPALFTLPHVVDLTGRFDLKQLSSFIQQADVLIACSTGVLHLGAALGTRSLGLYVPLRPIHPGRWRPVGSQAHYLISKENCSSCPGVTNCSCMAGITPARVKQEIEVILRQSLTSPTGAT
ncbi:MAG: glycosyltransferase [Cyclobacteriaceae bacterium]|jgi:heptosyltransferase-3